MFNSNNGNGYSLADFAAAVGNNNDGFGFGNGSWVLILFLAWIFYGNGMFGGWGNNGGGAMSTFNTDYLAQGLRDIQSGLSNNFLTLNNELLSGFCDNRTAFAENTASLMSSITNGFNTQNLANLQNSNAIQRDIYSGTVGAMQNTQAIQSTLAQMSAQDRADTCAVNTNNSNNTRDIIDAITSGNQMLANMMQQNKYEALQTENANLRDQLQRQTYLADNAAQTGSIVNQLRPTPVPAYQVQNPYCSCSVSDGKS